MGKTFQETRILSYRCRNGRIISKQITARYDRLEYPVSAAYWYCEVRNGLDSRTERVNGIETMAQHESLMRFIKLAESQK